MFHNPQITGPHSDSDGRRYLLYTEDVSKTNPGGMNQRRIKPKEVRAYEHTQNLERCYLRLYKKYKSLCPQTLYSKARDAFYLTPLKKPTTERWFNGVPVGHNVLQASVKKICSGAGIVGRKTIHSLRATAATRLFQANVDEQTICEQTARTKRQPTTKRSSDAQKAQVSDIIGAKAPKMDCPAETCSVPTDPVNVVQSVSNAAGKSISLTFNFN